MSAVRAILRTGVFVCAFCAAFTTAAQAHVGSPDVFYQGDAGPYSLLVTIRPPEVVPGIAQIEVRAQSAAPYRIFLTPTPMVGEGAKHPPVADVAGRSAADPRLFDGALWLMATGSWEVRIRAEGSGGSGELRVPVPAVALKTMPMQKGVSYFLFGMLIFLATGMVAIVGAAAREAQIEPGLSPAPWSKRTIAVVLGAAVVLVFAIRLGDAWWSAEASVNNQKIYKPLNLSASLDAPDHLLLRITDPGWLMARRLDDLVPDHGHIMHLFLIRWPSMDQMFHLHPDQDSTGIFGVSLPSLPAGTYRVFADIVHDVGVAETAAGSIDVADIRGKPLAGDDAGGPARTDAGDGYRMVRVDSQPVIAKQLTLFSFEIVGRDGKPAEDIEPYMGMGGHAVFIKDDGSVFAHIHPSGSVSMASVAIASPEQMMAMHQMKSGPVVAFPYGVPSPGRYRVFVQIKREGRVQTGAFDVTAVK